MKIVIEFETENEAFEAPGWGLAAARVLWRAGEWLKEYKEAPRAGYEFPPVRDSNGNSVGWMVVRRGRVGRVKRQRTRR